MKVINNSNLEVLISSEILVFDHELKPGKSHNYIGRNHFRMNIHSEIGSCCVQVHYDKQEVRNFGKLIAELLELKDEKGRKTIVIKEIE